MKASTKDRVEGSARQARGRIEEGAGKLVGNSRLRAKGRANVIVGKVQKKIGDIERTRGR